MATVSQVTEAVFRARYEDQMSAGANAAARAVEKLGVTVQETEEKVTRASRSGATWVNQHDAVTQAAKRAEKAERDLGTARKALSTDVAAGTVSQEQASRALDALATKAQAAREKLQALQAAEAAAGQGADQASAAAQSLAARLDAAAQAAQRAAQAQAAFNQSQGVRASNQDDYARRAADVAAYGAELDRLRAKFNPLYAASKQYENTLEEIAEAERLGAISAREAQAARERTTAAFAASHAPIQGTTQALGQVTNSLGLARHQMQNLTAQVVDFGVQISSGGGIFLPLVQQGPQAIDAMGGLSGAMRVLTQLATPLNVGIVAATAALATAVLTAERAERAINDLSARLRTTRSDFQELARDADTMARRLAGSTTLSTADARAAAGTIAGSRDFSGNRAELERLTKLSADVARAFGVTVPEAAQRLADGLKKPGDAARRMIDGDLRGMDDALRRQIELLEASGQKHQAQTLYTQAYARSVADAAAAMTPFERAMDEASKAATRLWNGADGKSGLRVILEGIGRPVVATAGGLISFLASVIDKLEQVRSKIEGLGWMGRLIAGDPTEAGAQANDWLRGRTSTPAGSPVTGSSDVAARILYGEAGGQGDQGLAAAAAVIVNRARLTGQSPDQVVMAPGQFEPWGNTATRDRLMAMSPAQYEQAARILAGVMSGQVADPTGGATHFYAPGLQSSLGRNRPAWAEGDGVRIGDQVFYARPQDFGQGSAVPGRGGRTLAAADEGLQNWDNQQVLRERNAAQISLYEAAAGTDGLSPERARDYADRLKELRAEAERLRDPMDELRRQGDEQARVFRQASGAAQELAAAELRGIQAARAAGEGPEGQAARGLEERRQAQARMNSELMKSIEATERDTAKKQAQTAALAGGVAAMQEVEIQRQAEIEALNFAIPGTADYTRNVNMLVQAKRDQKAADVDLSTGSLIAQQSDQIALLEQEARLIGLSTEARQAELAVMKERQRVANAGGDPDSDASRKAQDNIKRIASQQASNQQLTNSWNELARVGEQAFDRIGSAITEAFANGSLKAIDFKNIAKAVFSEVIQAGLRLAVINPVLNAVFGGTRGTLGGIGTVMGAGGGSLEITDSNGGLIGYASQGAQAYSAYSKLSGINPTSYINGSTQFATGWGGLDGVLNTPIWGASGGINAGGAVTNSAGYGSMAQSSIDAGGSAAGGGVGGLTYGGAATGALGIAGGLYGAYSGIQRGGVGGYTQAAGGAATAGLSAAAMASMAVPVYGWIAAAALTVLGALLPGQKPSDRTGTATFRTNEPGVVDINGLNGDRYSQENRDQARAIGAELMKIADQIGEKAGLGRSVETAYRVEYGARDGLNVYLGTDKLHGGTDEEGITAVTQAFVSRMLQQAMAQTPDANIRQIIGATGVADPDKTLANIDWYETTWKAMQKPLEQTRSGLEAFEAQLEQIKAPFQEVINKSASLGLATDELVKRQQEAADYARIQVGVGYDQSMWQAQGRGYVQAAREIRSNYTANADLYRSVGRNAEDLYNAQASQLLGGLSADQLRDVVNEFRGLDEAMANIAQSMLDFKVATDAATEAQQQAIQNQQTRLGYWQASRSAEGRDYINSVENVRTNWAENGASYAAAGLDPDRLYWQQLQSTLNGLNNEQLRDVAISFRGVDDAAADLAEQMLALGGSAAQVAEDLAKRQQAEQTVTGTLGGITDFIQSMQTDDSSLLSPQAKLSLTERDFNDVASRAASGDFDAISEFTTVAGRYRDAARSYYGSSAGFGFAQDRISSVAESIGNISADTLTNSAMASMLKTTSDSIVDAIKDLKTENQLFRQQLAGLLADR
ncbi:phage tail length tape measure family protein [Pseudoroseomonas ludipueritiae]|uniref:Phage tail length tape measure family protein n=1 Tax=Pseudoroseomonas ludipueritiae TaxID=198093 RepID=A0ABR7R560_9PROT|nr:phage tail length tape measure family protein [Pseudoroseomonas ludipueritiae]MBC9176760.1 phage tail length tape measure family protein [Pseudoroseomonas ludipueritiae]